MLWLACAPPLDPETCSVGIDIGDCAPAFALQDETAQWVERAAFDGAPLVVEFGAMWCHNCQEMAGELEALSQDGYAVLMVLFEDTGGGPPEPGDAALWAEHFGLSHPVLVDPGADVSRTWNFSGNIPETYLIDEDGLIRWRHVGATGRLRQNVERALGRP